jgi:hypothetical protein
MLGIVIYLIIPIALAAFTIHVFVNREEIRAKHAPRRDKPWEKIFIVLFIPLGSFAYFSMGGFPPKTDQIVSMTVTTLLMYGAVIFRWRRQARIGTVPPTPPAERRYYYRSTDGRSVCGPDTEAKLSVLVRMGLITADTHIADETSPQDWTPLRDRHDLTRLQQATAA